MDQVSKVELYFKIVNPHAEVYVNKEADICVDTRKSFLTGNDLNVLHQRFEYELHCTPYCTIQIKIKKIKQI